MVVLIKKGEADFWGIGIIEVLWKKVVVILKLHLGASITPPNVLYGLNDGIGMGNSPIEVKKIKKLRDMREEVLYKILLNLHKECNTLERDSAADEGGGYRGGGGEPINFVVYLTQVIKTVRCPVPGCQAVAHSAGRMRENFIYRNLFAWIEVVQEGREPLTRCDLWGMHMPSWRLLKHQRTKRCEHNMQMCWRRRDVAIVS